MAFPTPTLDDRTAQQIVDQAKRLIPRFCPEWTDHNVSDPGVALIELFAWMTELLLYRVNQVPDRMYVRFLEMVGIQLQPPRPAFAEVTFYTTRPLLGSQGEGQQPGRQEESISIEVGTEVATARSEGAAPVVFTTEKTVTMRPPIVTSLYTAGNDTQVSLTDRNLALLNNADARQVLDVFPQPASDGDGLYLRLLNDHSYNLLAVIIKTQTEYGATGIKPEAPPWRWEVSQEGDTWAPCEIGDDKTGGFSYSGELQLLVPATSQASVRGVEGFWLRCVVAGQLTTGPQEERNWYNRTPILTSLRVEVRGATASAINALIIKNESLGISSGAPGQIFQLQQRPVLPLVAEHDLLMIDGEPWRYVPDFAQTEPEQQVFTLDYLEGLIRLPPAALQPNGSVRYYGAVPEVKADLQMARYQAWGGHVGVLPAGALTVLRSSIKYIARVENRRASSEGLRAESPDDARIRAPERLRTITRAVTAQDYVHWASQIPGVARACCIQPGEVGQANAVERPHPGYVEVHVLPQAENPLLPQLDEHTLDEELKTALLERLNELRPLGIAVKPLRVKLVSVAVRATVRPTARLNSDARDKLKSEAQMALTLFLNPYLGGPDGKGWPFGRAIYLAELYARLQQVRGVAIAEDVVVTVNGAAVTTSRIELAAGALACSASHEVQVLEEPA